MYIQFLSEEVLIGNYSIVSLQAALCPYSDLKWMG